MPAVARFQILPILRYDEIPIWAIMIPSPRLISNLTLQYDVCFLIYYYKSIQVYTNDEISTNTISTVFNKISSYCPIRYIQIYIYSLFRYNITMGGDHSVTHKTGHARALINGILLAETNNWFLIEGNVYFPPSSINKTHFTPNQHHTHCPWKGDASYYDIDAAGEDPMSLGFEGGHEGKVEGVAWYYPKPFDTAKEFKDYVAFCEYSESHGWIYPDVWF